MCLCELTATSIPRTTALLYTRFHDKSTDIFSFCVPLAFQPPTPSRPPFAPPCELMLVTATERLGNMRRHRHRLRHSCQTALLTLQHSPASQVPVLECRSHRGTDNDDNDDHMKWIYVLCMMRLCEGCGEKGGRVGLARISTHSSTILQAQVRVRNRERESVRHKASWRNEREYRKRKSEASQER